MKKKRVLSLGLAAALFAASAVPGMAETTREKLEKAQSQQAETKSQLENTKNQISELENQKGEAEEYLGELNEELGVLQKELETLQGQAEEKQKELEVVQVELEEAKDQEEEQYEAMKMRIRYIYENANNNYLAILLEAKNFSEFLNRADNIAQLSQFDRELLAEYNEAKELVVEKETKVKEEKAAIEDLKEQRVAKEEEVQQLIDTTYDKIGEYAASIEDSQSSAASLLEQIDSQQYQINALMRQALEEEDAAYRAEQAKIAAEEAKKKAEEAQQQASQNQSSGSGSDKTQSSSGSSGSSSSSSSSSQGSYVQGSDNASIIWNFMISNGFTEYQAAGILGNWWVESRLNPAAVQPNGIGHGLGQWSFVRWTNLSNYAAKRGQPWSSISLQLEFFIYEWYQYYSGTFTGNESSASAAARSFYRKWEGCSIDSSKREAKAEEYYQRFAG
ncbi:MAG TPA: hypothetical protein IAB98_02790 [Candidatus Egerieimonas intestinavium]|uniref:Phage tail lysozyme domain-containing protein n=1 Tax=Candidatus Egerieimonas intestinavium TaxID=2840777 RepID=A0A9D1JF49_9FIRM|nr:hypothetical protein [Candidatus Egerieimonas intestinavium]